MTVKELLQTLEFKDIALALKEKYSKEALRPMFVYKENYDIACNTEFSGEGGTIAYQENGDSDVYMIEGDSYDNIVGMEVKFPKNNKVSKIEIAAEILWSATPFGRVTSCQWEGFFNELVNPPKANEYALQAKRIEILLDLPYCRDKKIRQELKKQMTSPDEDLCLSGEASKWLLFEASKRSKIRHNRSKRKRAYRLKNRYNELIRLREVNDWLNKITCRVGQLPEHIENLILSSKSIDHNDYQSQTYGNVGRVAYLEDLLLNPLYQDAYNDYATKDSDFICILCSSEQHPCSIKEQNRIKSMLSSLFKIKDWYLLTCFDHNLKEEIELDIISLYKNKQVEL